MKTNLLYRVDVFLAIFSMSLFGVSYASNIFGSAWLKAVKQTLLEQSVEDENSVHKFDNHLVRRLIVMPLTEAFNPSQISQMHSKVQYGDKCSLPGSIGKAIFEKPYEVPWLFEIKPVNLSADKRNNESFSDVSIEQQVVLPKAYISPLDFRAPENYIFLPRWLMRTMGLKSNDIVDISFVRLKLASLVVLQPQSIAWDKLIDHTKSPKTILEQEINKYSSLTCGATVAIEFDGIEYQFFVKETRAEGGVAVHGVRIQDSDVRVDIDRSKIDELLKEAKSKPDIGIS